MSINTTSKSNKLYQYIDLKEEFGFNFKKNPDLKLKVSQLLIDSMKDRIASGKDINGVKFKGYSKEYKKSDEFKAARKSSTVNMFLSGDMLGSIDVLNESSSTNIVKIGFDDREQELKAHGHQSGNIGVQREFFGISDQDIEKVRSKIERLLK